MDRSDKRLSPIRVLIASKSGGEKTLSQPPVNLGWGEFSITIY
jgi:hypothetical protein